MPLFRKIPGVYIDEVPMTPSSVAAVETAIPAFIGYTEIAEGKSPDDLRLKPIKINSLNEYEKYFGKPQKEISLQVFIYETVGGNETIGPRRRVAASLDESARSKHIMHYAMQMFFDNGGGPCYIVSVGGYKILGAALDQNELRLGLEVLNEFDGPTILVLPEAQSLPIAEFAAIHQSALNQCAARKDRFVIMDLHGDTHSLSDPSTDMLAAINAFRTAVCNNNNLQYGAAYAPNIETCLNFAIDESAIDVTREVKGITEDLVKLGTLANVDFSLYENAKAAIGKLSCKLPPSAAIAGIYASIDSSRGVWRAPANVSINKVVKPAIEITNTMQSKMNIDPTSGKSVNAIRAFAGKGTLVWGARTLACNDNEWRYISIRRLVIFVETSIENATQPFVFEPNDANTWVRIQTMIESFLMGLWRQGALQGAKPEQAFFVKVGLGKTMTSDDLLNSRIIIEIGIAAVKPAEFIALSFSLSVSEL